jgi:rhomboid protease GluP
VADEVPSEAVVRSSLDKGQAEAWAFVLEAIAIPHRLVETEAGYALMVPSPMVAPALSALDAQDKEAAEGPPRDVAPPDHGRSFVGLAMSAVFVAFYVVSGPRTGPDLHGWFRHGSALAQAIVDQHHVWRAVTALTLHASPMHVIGNIVMTLVFVTALGRWLGGGLALFAILLSGIAGNLLTAYIHFPSHDSVGASTAIFGAVGLLGGLQFVRRFRMRSLDRMRRALLGIAAALGLLAMLGMGDVYATFHIGERTDVDAHRTGLGFGILLGILLAMLVKRPVRTLGQGLALAATLAILVGSWLLAFLKP